MELDLGHASQSSGDGARDVAGGDVGGRAPVFAQHPVNPDEGQEGGGLQPRGAAGEISGKTILNSDSNASYYTGNNPLIINNTPVYASPPD